MGEVYIIQTDDQIAIADFRQETFETKRYGLKSIEDVIREMSVLTKVCKDVPVDLGELLRMADILEHPLALICRVAKNFLLNRMDIFKKVKLGMQAYTAPYYSTAAVSVARPSTSVCTSPPQPDLPDLPYQL